jgi:cell wall assembly regulator SMI1
MTTVNSNNRRYPMLTKTDISAFEQENAVLLPDDYRAFLLKHNGGAPNPRWFDCSDGTDVVHSAVESFFSIYTKPETETGLSPNMNLTRTIRLYKRTGTSRMPEELIPIGEDGVGNQICLCVSGEHTGCIYYWDHEMECTGGGTYEDGTPVTMWDNCHFVANSFTEFLDSLYEYVDEG